MREDCSVLTQRSEGYIQSFFIALGKEKKMKLRGNVRMMTTLAVLAALAMVLLILVRFPIFPAIQDLKYEPMDIPFLIAGFAFGPWAGLAVAVTASIIQGFTLDAQNGLVGILMHVIASGTLVLVASSIYKRKRNIKNAVIGLAAGTVSMTVIMIAANLLIMAPYYHIPVDVVIGLLPLIIAFNLIKAGSASLVTFLIYKPLRKIIIKDTPRDRVAQN